MRSMRLRLLSAAAIVCALACLGGCAGPNRPPRGLTALFNGKNLTGWKGLVADPPARAKMSPEQLAEAQKIADQRMNEHWSVADGALRFDGHGDNLCTAHDYTNFELLVDWRIPKGGDSGIYLRGSPQVQIWDNPIGSGGLYNNQKHPSQPLKFGDKRPGKWNHFRIRLEGEEVTVWLNGVLVVDHTVLENYWERSRPIYPTSEIELQNHGGELWYRNVFVKDLP